MLALKAYLLVLKHFPTNFALYSVIFFKLYIKVTLMLSMFAVLFDIIKHLLDLSQYGKILSFNFNIRLDLRSRPILKSQLNILPYCAQKNPISYNIYVEQR